MKRLLSYFLILSFAIASFAQEEASEPSQDLISETAAGETGAPSLEPYEITAYRFETDALDTPVNSSVITRDMIDKSGATSITEVLQKQANVRFMSYTGGSGDGGVSMRGFGENSEMRVLVLVDGQRFNRPDMATMQWTQIPLSSVESIEVLRGSQSAMYGNNAVAGVIKITRKKSEETNTLRLNGVYGSYGLYTADLSFAGRTGDVFYNVDLNRYNDDGYREGSASWTKSATASVGYDFSESTSMVLTGNYSEIYTEFPGALQWDDFRNNPRKGTLNQIYSHKAGVYSVALKNENASGRAEANFGINLRDREIQDNGLNGSTRTAYKYNDQWMFSFSPRYELTAIEDLKLFFGIDTNYADIAYHKDAVIRRYVGPGQWLTERKLAEFATITRFDIGAYTGGEYKLTDELSLTFAGRAEAARTAAWNTRYKPSSLAGTPQIDPDNSYVEDVWTWGLAASVGLNYRLTEESSVYFRFDQVYRYPTTDEIAFYQGVTQAENINFNRDLKPERGQNFELGYKYINEKWNAGIDFFALYLNNEIMYDIDEKLNVNFDPTLRYGVDMNLSYDDEVWGAFATATIVRSEFVSGKYSGERVPLVPLFNTTAGLWVKPLENVRLLGRLNYSSNQVQGNDFTNVWRKVPDYVTFDIQMDIKLCRYGSVFFAVDNLADETYAVYAYNGGFYPGRGRTFKVGINLQY